MRRSESNGDATASARFSFESRRYRFTVVALLLILLCCSIIVLRYRYMGLRRNIESGIRDQLSAIADLKVQQVSAWRNERIADAEIIAANPSVDATMSGTSDRRLRAWLDEFRRHAGYSQVALLDRGGQARMSASDGSDARAGVLLPLVQAAERSGEVVVSELYPGDGGATYMDVVAPPPGRKGARNAGAVLIHQEASALLYAVVEAWPTMSLTAESLLVRPEGDHVILLSKLRYKRPSTRGPRNDTLGIRATRGTEGFVSAIDYRGVPVLAVIRRVPGTPWSLVAKMDANEAYAPLRTQALASTVMGGLALTACLALCGFYWSLQQRRSQQRQHLMESERRALEERYAQLRRCVNDIVLLLDDEGRILEANDRAVSTYGYSLEELLQLSIRDLLDPSEFASFDSRWQQLTADGSDVFEGRHRRKDGTSLAVEVSSRTTESEGRRYHQSVIRDISDRKRAEEDLRRAVRAMRVLSASNQSVIRTGDAARLLDDICDAITKTGGYPLAWVGFPERGDRRLVRVVAQAGISPEALDALRNTLDTSPNDRRPAREAIRTGQVVVWNDMDADPDLEPWRVLAAEHGYKAVVSLPLRCDDGINGALTIYAAEAGAFHPEEMRLLEELAADLTYGLDSRRRRRQQAQAEWDLLRSATEFRALFDIANDAIFITDLEGTLLEANEVASQRLGYTHAELLTMRVSELETPAWAAGISQRRADLIERGEELLVATHMRKDGSELPVEINSRVFQYREQPAILSVARDVTERKRAEVDAQLRTMELERAKAEAENANRAKSEFLANMSHEMRTPMFGIMGTTDLFLGTSLTAEQKDYAATIQGSAKALLGIVNDVLDFSKIEAGQMKVKPTAFDIVACLRESADTLRTQAHAKGLEYSFVAETDFRWVEGDAGRLRQIILNLLSNAIEFTERGRVALKMTSSPAENAGYLFRIAVDDTGVGIAPDQLPLLFHKFSQLDASLKKAHGGVGLGLAISRELAELMGGSLTVSSKRGSGSRFLLTLQLPLAAPEDSDMAAPQAPRRPRENDVRAPRSHILVAEDNLINQKIVVRMLRRMGCDADIAVNGREAVETIARTPYDLILMDCGMPEMDGFEATKEIRARQSKGQRTPIVALTAHVVAGTREQCIAAGMDDYVTKPVSAATLERILQKWIPCRAMHEVGEQELAQ